MDKFNYGDFDPSADLVFDSNKGYTEVSGETNARQQLSSPLNQIKDYVNKTTPIDITTEKVIQFGVTPRKFVQFRREEDGIWEDISAQGEQGPPGEGVAEGGTTGQVLTKASNRDYDTEWTDTQGIFWGDEESSTPAPLNADQLEGYSLNNLIKFMFPIGSVLQNTTNVNPSTYIAGTTWRLISSVALASEHVFGNGKATGLSDGEGLYGLLNNPSDGKIANTNYYGSDRGVAVAGGTWITSAKTVGIVTKEQAGNTPENSGLIADTITLYTWERTA